MNALVTGGGGFVGKGLVERLLARGDTVTALGRNRYTDLEEKGARVVVADLSDREAAMRACEGRDVVFHVAAKAGIWGDYAEYHRINVEGTRNIVDGCLRHGVGRLVYTSSPSVTFDGRDAVHADESLPYPARFESAYAETKAIAERMVLEADGRDGLAVTSLRPHLIWGPGDPHLIPRVVAAARQGRLLQVGDGTNLVDITYIDSVVEAHVRAGDRLSLDSPLHGRVYFISEGEPVRLWPWINGLLERLSIPPVRRSISLGAARALGTVLETVHRTFGLAGEPRMTRFLASQLATSHYYDISAARRDLGFEPQGSKGSMDERLDRLLAWLKGRGLA